MHLKTTLETIARNAVARRAKLGISAQAVADAAGLELTQYQRIERAVGNPTLRTLLRVAAGLETTLLRLLK